MDTTVITVSGPPGSGTTTVARMLAEKTGFRHVNMGDIFRELAEEHRMELNHFERYCEEHPEIDREIDKKQEEILRRGGVVMEGRLSGWIAHLRGIRALKVWLECDEQEAIRRIIEREGGEAPERRKETMERMESERRRYRKFYGIDTEDRSIYDLVIDTTSIPPEKVVETILQHLKA